MALYKHSNLLQQSQHANFDLVYSPGASTPDPGIYRCTACGHEIGIVKGHTLPPQNHHQHSSNIGAIRWQLVVCAISTFSSVLTLSICGVLLPSPASATTVNFSLGSTSQLPFTGVGYAIVDPMLATGFTGSVLASYIYFSFLGGIQSGPFGTDYGNVNYAYNPQDGGVTVIRSVTIRLL